jgi:hypothetical protein
MQAPGMAGLPRNCLLRLDGGGKQTGQDDLHGHAPHLAASWRIML